VAHGDDDTFAFSRPDGGPLPDVPPSAAVPEDPAGALREHHGDLDIHARTACPSWLGERLDVSWALDVLRP
jgi:hypothetical protein